MMNDMGRLYGNNKSPFKMFINYNKVKNKWIALGKYQKIKKFTLFLFVF